MKEVLDEILITQEELTIRTREMGAKITEDYRGKDLVLIGILKGSVLFMADLAKTINLPLSMDFMSVTSYGDRTESSGVVRILKDLDHGIEGKDVLIVEDIIDSGLTLSYLKKNLTERRPKSLKIATLLDKPDRRVVDYVKVDYLGFVIPDLFVVGYGLDYAEKYRNIPCIGVLKPEIYTHGV